MYHVKYHIPLPFFFPNHTKAQHVQPNPLTNPLTNPFINPTPQPSTLQKKEECNSTENK
jgi:hypothetical protein